MIINNKKSGGKWKRSSLEKSFERLWTKMYPEIDLIVEQCLVPGRKFRTDYLHEATKVTIELNGGMYLKKSSHKGAGSLQDYEKANTLLLLGYVTINLGTGMVTKPNLTQIAAIIDSRSL